jgi:hypothetical protein
MPRPAAKTVCPHPDYDQNAPLICLPYDDTGENALPARPARKRDRDEDIDVEPEENERRASRMRAWQEMDRREDNKQTNQDTRQPMPVSLTTSAPEYMCSIL